jgi:hypothetical protein
MKAIKSMSATTLVRVVVLTAMVGLLVLAGDLFFHRTFLRRNSNVARKHACVGLRCWDASDCGTKCNCVSVPGESLGQCKSKD